MGKAWKERMGGRHLLEALVVAIVLAWQVSGSSGEWPCEQQDRYWPGAGSWAGYHPPACLKVVRATHPAFPSTRLPWRSFAASAKELCYGAMWGGRQLVLPAQGGAEATGAAAWLAFIKQTLSQAASPPARASGGFPFLLVPVGASLSADGSRWRWPSDVVPSGVVDTVDAAPGVVLGNTPASTFVLVMVINTTAGTSAGGVQLVPLTVTALAAAADAQQVAVVCQARAPAPCPAGFLLSTPNVLPGNGENLAVGALNTTRPLSCLGLVLGATLSAARSACGALGNGTARARALGSSWGLLSLNTLQNLTTLADRVSLLGQATNSSGRKWWTGAIGEAAGPDSAAGTALRLRWPDGSLIPDAEGLPGFSTAASACANSLQNVGLVYSGATGSVEVVCAGAPGQADAGVSGALCQGALRLQLRPILSGHFEVGQLVAQVPGYGPTLVCTVGFTAQSGSVACKELGYDGGSAYEVYNNDGGARLVTGKFCGGWEGSLDECNPDGTVPSYSKPANSPDGVTCPGHDAATVACFMNPVSL